MMIQPLARNEGDLGLVISRRNLDPTALNSDRLDTISPPDIEARSDNPDLFVARRDHEGPARVFGHIEHCFGV